jgi:hypothetical protein
MVEAARLIAAPLLGRKWGAFVQFLLILTEAAFTRRQVGRYP